VINMIDTCSVHGIYLPRQLLWLHWLVAADDEVILCEACLGLPVSADLLA